MFRRRLRPSTNIAGRLAGRQASRRWRMFLYASAFNQDIGGNWAVHSVKNMRSFRATRHDIGHLGGAWTTTFMTRTFDQESANAIRAAWRLDGRNPAASPLTDRVGSPGCDSNEATTCSTPGRGRTSLPPYGWETVAPPSDVRPHANQPGSTRITDMFGVVLRRPCPLTILQRSTRRPFNRTSAPGIHLASRRRHDRRLPSFNQPSVIWAVHSRD